MLSHTTVAVSAPSCFVLLSSHATFVDEQSDGEEQLACATGRKQTRTFFINNARLVIIALPSS